MDDEPGLFRLAAAFLAGVCGGFAASAFSMTETLRLYGTDSIAIVATLGIVLAMLCVLERLPRLTIATAAIIMLVIGAGIATVKIWRGDDAAINALPPPVEGLAPHFPASDLG